MFIFDYLRHRLIGPVRDFCSRVKSGELDQNEWIGPTSLRARWRYVLATIEMIKQKPFLGHGLGSYSVLFPTVAAQLHQEKGEFLDPEKFREMVSEHTHSDWLEEFQELGPIGFIFLFLIFGTAVISGTDPWLTGAMVAMLVNALFFFPLREAAPGLYMWVIAGMLCC
jgi:O-antigen ligase